MYFMVELDVVTKRPLTYSELKYNVLVERVGSWCELKARIANEIL